MASDLSKPTMEVPPEVLGQILAHLEKKELKQVRLVCKQLERSAVPLLFDEVYLSANPAEIEIAQKTVQNFGKSIKTVYLSAVEYEEMKWGKFKSAVGRYDSLEHVRLAYTNYCKLCQEQEAMFRAGTYFGHLCYVLRTVPNAQRLVMTDFEAYYSRSYKPWEKRRLRLWRVGDCPAHCSIQGCACGSLEHLSLMVDPRSLLHGERASTDPWSLVMMGLAATGSQITELALAPLSRGYVPRGGFDNTLQQPFSLQEIFQRFRKLRLGFRVNDGLVEKHIAQTLSAATQLKSLCVILCWDAYNFGKRRCGGPTVFQEILGECQFPQLRSLILDGFGSTEGELVGFLRGSSRLQHLTLTKHHLTEKGRWDSCADSIQVALPSLEHILIHDVTSGASDVGFHGMHDHFYSHRELLGFFFQGKANPFTRAQTRDERTYITFIITDDANRPLEAQLHDELWKASYLKFH
ncbi:hypothetical protein JMJ35_008091 [Cladonia borealis]|uniref:F-box domain-containing protein n=1 Tax=Cladonia borealis TaxID=184061 RepID=A0AA39UZG2_9LECA|nr:hypothetical protein JMJ35_008091 [Cladonia borealis]